MRRPGDADHLATARRESRSRQRQPIVRRRAADAGDRDEPTEGLAPLILEELLRALGTITRAGRTCSVIVEQNAQKILGLADRVVISERRAIVHDAANADFMADPAVLERYLGASGLVHINLLEL